MEFFVNKWIYHISYSMQVLEERGLLGEINSQIYGLLVR